MNGSMRRAANGILRVGAGAALIAVTAGWGPHSQIARVALRSIDRDNPLVRFMGSDAEQIARNGWLPDHFRERPYGSDRDGNGYFQPRDYMVFRGAPSRPSHMPPSMYVNSAPFFRRALLYLRTQPRAKCARQIAALNHFIQDNGSPPHALGIGGALHVTMEHDLRESDIRIGSYHPRLLGRTESEAITGLIRRCHALEAYSTIRAKKALPLIKAGRLLAARPYVIECANECARANADAMHTLGVLLGRSRPGTAALAWPVSGKVSATWKYPNGRVHGAVDVAAAADAVAGAGRRGTVLVADYGTNRGFGNYVRVGHGNGYTTDYHHFHKLLTRKGRSVDCMTSIGTAGVSGTPVTPQVHFELRRYGTKVQIPATLAASVRKGTAVPGSWAAF